MMMIASTAQLQAMGYWQAGPSTGIFGDPPVTAATRNIFSAIVLMQLPNAVSLFLPPYIALLSLAFVAIGVSYADPVLKSIGPWKCRSTTWRMYHAGQLHREVLEQVTNAESEAS